MGYEATQLDRFSEISVASEVVPSESAELTLLLRFVCFFRSFPSVLMFRTDFLKSLFVVAIRGFKDLLGLSDLGTCGGSCFLVSDCVVDLGGVNFDFFFSFSLLEVVLVKLLLELFRDKLFGLSMGSFLLGMDSSPDWFSGLEYFKSK